GLRIGNETFYYYPSVSNNWERISCAFTLNESTKVTLSMGLRTTQAVGAANNTRLYLDDIRLWQKPAPVVDGIKDILPYSPSNLVDVYTLQGLCIRSQVTEGKALHGLSKGVYIVGNRKVAVE
ncbi:MAG: hypothetical protein II222_04270, partial [Paraprevotella sp.]|nr:hypothetical protein [Paraprevotella sp.]